MFVVGAGVFAVVASVVSVSMLMSRCCSIRTVVVLGMVNIFLGPYGQDELLKTQLSSNRNYLDATTVCWHQYIILVSHSACSKPAVAWLAEPPAVVGNTPSLRAVYILWRSYSGLLGRRLKQACLALGVIGGGMDEWRGGNVAWNDLRCREMLLFRPLDRERRHSVPYVVGGGSF